MNEIKFLKSNEAARYLGVSRSSLIGWMKQGFLSGEATPGGHYRFTLVELNDFARKRGMSVNGESKGAAVPEEKTRILIIEDDPAFREFVRDALEIFRQCEIEEASDGIQGALLLGTWHPDLIILDIRMPNVNGIEFLRLLRKNPATHAVQIVVASAQLTPEIRRELTELGVCSALEKPVRLAQLINEVQDKTHLIPG